MTSLSFNLMLIYLARKSQIALLVIKKMQILALNEKIEAFIVYITSLLTMAIHLAKKAQIVLLVAEKIKIPIQYSDFSDVFSEKKALILPNATELNQHATKLQESQ